MNVHVLVVLSFIVNVFSSVDARNTLLLLLLLSLFDLYTSCGIVSITVMVGYGVG